MSENVIELPELLWLARTDEQPQLVEVIGRRGSGVTVLHTSWAAALTVQEGQLSLSYPVETVVVKTREQLSADAARVAAEHARGRKA
jgi:ABC-type uncharacterized transport system ATPase component